jgi:hypothetical protein
MAQGVDSVMRLGMYSVQRENGTPMYLRMT